MPGYLEWAQRAIQAYRVYHADRIVGEVNNGGALVEHTLRSVDPGIPFKAVHASRGKLTRAEPVAALYEQGRVHHVGVLGPLEDQLTGYDGSRPERWRYSRFSSRWSLSGSGHSRDHRKCAR